MRRRDVFPRRRCACESLGRWSGHRASGPSRADTMSEWWTYRLTSFLLFSPRTYYRTIELYNLAVWPAQILGLAVGIAIVILLATRSLYRDRIIAALLGVCWLWIGWAFHYERYAQINWVAPWIGALFALEAALLAVAGAIGGRIVFE